MPISTPAERSLRQLVDSGERPFPSHPRVERYFPAAAIEDARRRLGRAIERGDGPGLVIGAAGMGKTLLLQALAAQFHERFDVVLLGCARLCTRRALLQAILFELGLPHRLRDEGRLRLTLLDHLLSSKDKPTQLLLLVDEAQTLPVTLLDELRVMTNLADRGVPLVRLVLAGSPALEETFASPELESLSQRLAARSYLSPFSREETAQYIRAQLHASGAAVDEVLRPEAWEAVFEATDGVPRLVNQLCDRALLVATAENCKRLDRRIIQDAWADLQQLPSPWQSSGPVGAATATNVIEYGRLDDLNVDALSSPVDRDVAPSTEIGTSPTPLPAAAEDERPHAQPTGLADAIQEPKSTSNGVRITRDERNSSNPFDEVFDDEEVVIDGFASMHHLFAKTTPRVENRRDAQFATLARAALNAIANPEPASNEAVVSPTESVQQHCDTTAVASEPMNPSSIDPSDSASPYDAFPIIDELETYHVLPTRVPDPDDLIDELDPHWPPIRLAFAGAPEDDPSAAASVDVEDGTEWPTSVRSSGSGRATESMFDETPVLVVEDDDDGTPGPTYEPPRPTVRRQEYRRLFSRLRSG
jgi:type II secretory pathway predicted ATPase ExeA